MIFKPYQTKVAKRLKDYLVKATELKEVLKDVDPDAWVQLGFSKIGLNSIPDSPRNGLGKLYPRMCIKVPTGGGKTLLAVETIRQYHETFAKRKTGLVVWIVPSEIIYSQTVERLRDKADPYRQLLDQASSGHTIILEKGQELRAEDIEENLVVLMLMIQSVNRQTKESLKVFMDSGSYDSFFPQDNRYDLHHELLEKVSNLDVFQGVNSFMPQVKTSLGNVLRLTRPLIIIDEIHKVFSDKARETVNSLNPSMVVGFSATPKSDMNILVSITGQELKDAEMVKLDMNIIAPTNNEDWQTMVKEIKDARNKLEKVALEYDGNTGQYIRPIALIQVERTGKEQRGKGWVHSEDVKEYLINIGIPEEEIAIKSSSVNDIENIDLLSRECIIRYIITKDALKEGWDCPFAYILGIIPNVNSNTSVTQLVGRILRQPFGKKIGIPLLDESYIYYCSGHTQNILNTIKNGFKNEGLDDLAKYNINTGTQTNESMNKVVKIKREFLEKYPESLYLPVWLIKESNELFREFNYSIDIKPKINYENVDLRKVTDEILPLIGNQTFETSLIKVGLQEGLITENTSSEIRISEVNFDIEYLTRRLNDYIENAFLSRYISQGLYSHLNQNVKDKIDLGRYNGFIISEIIKVFEKNKSEQEKEIFNKMVAKKTLILAVSDTEVGFKIPEEDKIKDFPHNRYQYYLYEDFDITSINGLELDVAKQLDRQKKTIWWVRNRAVNGWYAIQGWQKDKVRPDFVVARKNDNDKLDLVYVVESKGEHLEGNKDTIYKSDLLNFMNEIAVEKIENKEMVKARLNDKFYYELVTQENYENKISFRMNMSN
ncbi:MAG: DEAD/DEAH box helicase [Candidatus Dojkabacteria bacterium]